MTGESSDHGRYETLKEIVRSRLEGWPPQREGYHWAGYTYDHTLRVTNLATAMGRTAGADERVIRYAALLHDIAKPVGDEHARVGAQQARELLEKLDFKPEFTARVTFAIATHAGGTSPGDPLENFLLGDADFIDANFGLVGTWRFITIRGGRGDDLTDIVAGMAEWLQKKDELAMRLKTDLGSSIAYERLERMMRFCGVLEASFLREGDMDKPQVWLARYIHAHSDTGRLMRQVKTLTNGTTDKPPTEVTPLLERLEKEIDGEK
ncbi:MAG: HD domain-containing protein [Armatimonadota bacterium]